MRHDGQHLTQTQLLVQYTTLLRNFFILGDVNNINLLPEIKQPSILTCLEESG